MVGLPGVLWDARRPSGRVGCASGPIAALIDRAFVFLTGEPNLTRRAPVQLRQMPQYSRLPGAPDPSGGISPGPSVDRGTVL
jgi:hypothetical protein